MRPVLDLAAIARWNADNERARLAYANMRPGAPVKSMCSKLCGRRTQHASGACAHCRRRGSAAAPDPIYVGEFDRWNAGNERARQAYLERAGQ